MSMRSIVEFNHDCIEDLKDKGHISDELFLWICSESTHTNQTRFGPVNGLRYLRLRHHSERVKLEIV